MAISVTHNFVSAKTDGADATLVQKTAWNDQHVITLATAKVLGRATAGTGAVEELVTTGTGDVVLANSPALITPALGTPASGVVTNLTGTGAGMTAGAATVLATARAIDGVGFDGSAAITVIAPGTHAATGKTTPVDADELPIVDSAASYVLKKLTWANLKATLKTYFDTLYAIPGIPVSNKSADYTLALGDANTCIQHPSADTTARAFTIPANSSVAFPVGTAITFNNQNGAGVVTIPITTDTMRLAGAGTTGTRTLAANGVATAIKETSTEWKISGTGLT